MSNFKPRSKILSADASVQHPTERTVPIKILFGSVTGKAKVNFLKQN